MKFYRNKKIYNFKKKHLRKKRARSSSARNDKLVSSYTKEAQEQFRAISKEVLRKQMAGRIVEFPLHKKTMSWDW